MIQGLCLTTSRAVWAESDAGLSPMDAAMQVAIPEFDGRLITVPFSFKEDGAGRASRVYVADPERARASPGIASAHARLRARPQRRQAGRDRAVVLPDQALPGRQRRRPRHPGLRRRAAARAARGGLRPRRPGSPSDGDELIHALIAAGGHDVEWLTEEQLAAAPGPGAAGRRTSAGSTRCPQDAARRR